MAVGDFNGDGRADLAVVSASGVDAVNGFGGVSIFLGKGDGTFQLAVKYSVLAIDYSVAVGDFNEDGKADLVVTNWAADSVVVLLGKGDGTFSGTVYNTGRIAVAVAVSDFNGDGHADLVVANNGGASVSILLGNGDGTFSTAVSYGTGVSPNFVAVGDFNGDGNTDLAVANQGGNVSVLLGNGNGTFQVAVSYSAGTNPYALAVGDFNGDGYADLAVANGGSDNVSILLGAPLLLTSKNSASFVAGVPLAPDMIAIGETTGIAPTLVVTTDNPWPITLGGARLEITDSQGQTRPAPIYFVAPGSMGYLIPAATALGHATIRLTTSTGASVGGGLDVERISPGVYSANASGSGVAAGFAIRVGVNGARSQNYLFDLVSRFPVPVDLGAADDQVFLSLYGTGFRGATDAAATVGGVDVPVYGFAPDSVYQGLDVVNIGPLPQSLARRGQVDVVLTFDSKTANTVTVSIK